MADPLRTHLARVLDWHEAHVTFEQAVHGIPPASRGLAAPGFEHTAWQLLEHLRIAQSDLLDFCTNAEYAHALTWPAGYWPDTAAPTDDAAWDASVTAFRHDCEAMKALVLNEGFDLYAPVPSGKPTQTGLRAILLTIDHNSYHVGQLVSLRRALALWPA
jgi:hypothetical protein